METNSTREIMIDLESFGVDDDALLLQISAISYDSETLEVYSVYDEILSLNTMSREIKPFEPSTLIFWLKEDNVDVFRKLIEKGNQPSTTYGKVMTEKRLATTFHKWLSDEASESAKIGQQINIWGNGISFDIVKINRLFKKFSMSNPLPYFTERDVRTLVDYTCRKLNIDKNTLLNICGIDKVIQHDALNDVKFQITLVNVCEQVLVKNKVISNIKIKQIGE